MQSGWSLYLIRQLNIKISKYVYLPGRAHIKLPKWILAKKAVLSVYNLNDELCFKYSILAASLHKKGEKITLKNIKSEENNFNFSISLPPTPKEYSRFCTLNKCSLNVLGVSGKNFYPIYLSKKTAAVHFNLLYYCDNLSEEAHYSPIVNLSRLLSSQVSRHRESKFFCLRCMLFFPSQERLDVHTKYCGEEQLARIVLPNTPQFCKFDRFDACHRHGLLVTLDFESYLEPISTCFPAPNTSHTTNIHKHTLASYGLYSKCFDDTPAAKLIPQGYFGLVHKDPSAIEQHLFDVLIAIAKGSRPYFESNYPLSMSLEDEADFQTATVCYACQKPFSSDDLPVRDHSHYLPENNYLGKAHNSCNLLMRRKAFIPIYGHNAKNYEFHILVKLFASPKIPMRIIPHTSEKYLTFSVRLFGTEMRMLDSYKLFASSLESAIEALPQNKFTETHKSFPDPIPTH